MNTRGKTLILDLDGTVTPHSTWAILNTAFGITAEQDNELFEQYQTGTLPYFDWTKQIIDLYKKNNSPLTKQQLIQLAENIELSPDAVDFVKITKEKGYVVVLVSGSVDILVETIANRLNTDSWLACSKAVFEDNVLVDLVSMGDEGPAKIKLVNEAGINLSKNTVSVGDGGNEKELFELTTGILIGSNQTLLPLAKMRVDSLTDILKLI
jgi:HAD superfamily phosphoserine phosphatase-like hydrolase